MDTRLSKKKSLFVENALLSVWEVELRTARSMVLTLSNSNASFAAQFLNGSAGVTRISVSHVIRSNAEETMSQERRKTNFRNALEKKNAP